jgi:hypothetical protein
VTPSRIAAFSRQANCVHHGPRDLSECQAGHCIVLYDLYYHLAERAEQGWGGEGGLSRMFVYILAPSL